MFYACSSTFIKSIVKLINVNTINGKRCEAPGAINNTFIKSAVKLYTITAPYSNSCAIPGACNSVSGKSGAPSAAFNNTFDKSA